MQPKTVSKLIDFFVPENYQLSVNLHRVERTFDGVVTITGSSVSDSSIMLHAKDLDIASVTFDGKEASFTAGDDDELAITHPDIKAGSHILVVKFAGKITDPMHGLYPCYYQHDGVKKELLATQFESHHAREVFPCIDEPAAKATFDLTLSTECDIMVLSNMPIHRQTAESSNLVTTFETSPRMSPYLLAWVAGELQHKTTHSKGGVEIGVWATPAQPAESLDFALEFATRTVDFFDEYFGVPYPLPKLDHIALPDFSSGAMENWGLVTYRESALLADPATTGISTKQYVATVIAHETSHQWFGDLVTMQWWNDLWLNESFANLMEYVAVDALQPDWNVWLDFSTQESISALRRDSIDGVQSVQIAVHHPDEINSIFDPSIVYAKGGRLLRMVRKYIGEDAFRKGLTAYFTQHQYSNTVADDLWNAFAAASGKDVSNLMHTWLTQSGFPVVSVVTDGTNLKLNQKRFFIGPHQPSDYIWPIPLNATDSKIPEMFNTPDAVVPYSGGVVRLNDGDTAHFITHYSPELFQLILAEVSNGTLSVLDRLQLLHEQTLLARDDIIKSSDLIPLLRAYKNETAESVWDIMALTIAELKKFVEGDDAATASLRRLASDIAAQQYARLGWDMSENEPETDTKLRATILGLMLYSENQDVITTAINRYKSAQLADLDPELRGLIIGAYVRQSGDASAIDTLLGEYRTATSPDLRLDIGNGLSSTKDTSVITKLLDLTKDANTVRPQDSIHWFLWLLRNLHGRELAWKWIRNNWEWVESAFGGDKSFDYFPRYTGSCLCTRQQLQEYRDFFTPMQHDPALTRVIAMGISDIEGRVELIERDGAAVREALRGQ